MAEVWEGRDEVLSRPVAVKVLMAHLASDPFLRERFRREAVTAARLVHPGIVAIFDAGVEVLAEEGAVAGTALASQWSSDERQRIEMAWPEQPSTAFIIMELVPGETLRDLISRTGPMAPELAVAITAQVTDALAYAHAQGLVHRDIKPANVLLGTEGPDLVRVKVADFGIAKAAATAHLDLTASGTLLGTPKYLAPEQVQGNEPDARADLYSLGVVLYEMLAGQAPFKGSTEMATALAHVQQQPPPLEALRPGLPPALYELVNALLVKDPAQRVPSALVLGGALTALRRQMGLPPVEAGPYIKVRTAAPGERPSGDRTRKAPSRPLPVPSGRGPGDEDVAPARTSVLDSSNAPTNAGAIGGTVPLGTDVTGQTTNGASAVGASTEVALPVPSAGGPRRRGAADGTSEDARRRRRRRTGRAASVLVVLLLLAGSGVVYDLVHTAGAVRHRSANPGVQQPTPGTSPANAGGAGPVKILSVQELTQDGNSPNDNLGTLDDVITGKSPAWASDQYKGSDFGGYGGFGLVLHLGSTRALSDLEVDTTMQGWSARVYVSNADHGAVSQWGQPTSAGTNLYDSQTFSLGGRKGSWVLFWMLNPGGSDQAVVDRLTVT